MFGQYIEEYPSLGRDRRILEDGMECQRSRNPLTPLIARGESAETRPGRNEPMFVCDVVVYLVAVRKSEPHRQIRVLAATPPSPALPNHNITQRQGGKLVSASSS